MPNVFRDRARNLFRTVDSKPDPADAESALAADNPELAWEEFGEPRARARRRKLEQAGEFARIEVSEDDRAAARAALDRLKKPR